jgi:hypothetical protein
LGIEGVAEPGDRPSRLNLEALVHHVAQGEQIVALRQFHLAAHGKGTGAVILGQATSEGIKLAADQAILDSSGLELLKFTKTATAVNEVTIANAATGNAPSIAATGETNVPLIVKAKGTGTLTLGQATGSVQIATVATDKIGLYDATPVVRANHIIDAAGGAVNDAEARTAINAVLVALENIGILKTS